MCVASLICVYTYMYVYYNVYTAFFVISRYLHYFKVFNNNCIITNVWLKKLERVGYIYIEI